MTSMSLAPLFEPFQCKSLRLRNRIAMASMARWASPGGNPAALADFYTKRIRGGAALVMTEGAAINRPASYNDPQSARFFGPALEGWKTVVQSVHAAGGAIAPQLWHCGAVGKKGSDWVQDGDPESPSGLVSAGNPRGHAMTNADLDAVLKAYSEAGAAARDIGFDAVEVHAGHGYLLDQFLWAETNRRSDRWGGATLVARSRFPLEAVRCVRAAAGSDLPLFLRISHWKSADLAARYVETPAELEAWLMPFAKAGVDLFSVSDFRWDTPLFRNSPLSFAGWVRKVTGLPVMTCGAIGMSGDLMATFGGETGQPQPVDAVARHMADGEFDLVAVGRALLANPDWADRTRNGAAADLAPCTPQLLAPGV